MAYSCGDARNRLTLTSFNDFKTRYLGTSLVQLGNIRNADLHRDLQMEMVRNKIAKFAKKHDEKLLHHVNVEAIHLLDSSDLVRGLKRRKNRLSWCSEH